MTRTADGKQISEDAFIIAVFFTGPWEILSSALFSIRKDGEMIREVKEGSLRFRLACWADDKDARWRHRLAKKGRRPSYVWRAR